MKILNYHKKSVKLYLVLAFFLFTSTAFAPIARAVDTTTFLIDRTYDTRNQSSVTATNRMTGLNAYFFVEDAYWNSKSYQEQNDLSIYITSLSNEFDNTIYPKMHQLYGEEWSPGIDGDRRIYILLTDIKSDKQKGSYGGYFSTANEYSKNLLDDYKKTQLEALEKQKAADIAAGKNTDYYPERVKEINSIFTNEKELLYLNVNFLKQADIRSFLAHEFQHMINWSKKSKISNTEEEVWLNEALSEYAPTALGYDNIYKGSNLEAVVDDFNHNPSDPITEWEGLNQDYSNVNIFMQFLVGYYGTDILKAIEFSPNTGIAAINDALKKIDPRSSFNNIFSDWVATNYFNGKTIQNKKYAYSNPNLNYQNLHISATSSFMLYSTNTFKNDLVKGEENIKDWAGKWYQFTSSPILSVPNQTLNMSFSANAPDANFQISYVTETADGTLALKNIDLRGTQSKNISIDNFGTAVKSVVVMPINERLTTNSGEEDVPVKFSYTASLRTPNQTPLSIKDISPKTSELGNKTLVTITGENFFPETTVKFGGIPATEITMIDPNTLIAKAPPSFTASEVDVEITNPDKISIVLPKAFAYASTISDGTLIRAEGDYRVYVITGKYKRWIQSEKIFAMYNYKWNDIKAVTQETRNSYMTSTLVRADNDYKVYEIGLDGKKHHLSMSGEKFSASGRQWSAIFIINTAEKNSYRTGAVITK